MVVLANRVKVSTSTTGTTSPLAIGTAVAGYQDFFDAAITDGEVVSYTIEDGTSFEIGRGVYATGGKTLTRNVLESSNSNGLISLSGNATIFISAGVNEIYHYAVTTINADQTLEDNVEYETGSGTTILSGVTLTIPASSQLVINNFTEKRPL